MMAPKSIIIGTAGHVDHGKTSLIKALTGIDTDRLKEEKERGITIDIGFAHLKLPSGILAGIVDVPGHERFIHNMIVGAGGLDLVMLVVAADEGIMPQTVEHLEICELLGVKDGIVVLTKIDLVDEEFSALVKEEVQRFLQGTFLEGAPLIPFSAITSQGKEEIIKELDKKAQAVKEKPIDKPFRMPIDGVFTVRGYGTVVRGTALSGRITLNQEVVLYPQGLKTKVRSIQVHGNPVSEAFAGMRTALNLQGLSKEEVKRGNVVSEPNVLKPSQCLDVEIKASKNLQKPLKNLENLLCYLGTSEVLAKLVLIMRQELGTKERDMAQLILNQPVVCWRGDRFILRRPGTNETVAGGKVLNPISQPRRRTKPWEKKELELLASEDLKEISKNYLHKTGWQGLSIEEFSLRLSLFGKDLSNLLSQLEKETLILKEGDTGILFLKEKLWELKKSIYERLVKFHQANPLAPGLNKEFLRGRLTKEPHPLLLEKALEELVEENKIARDRELYYLPHFRGQGLAEVENLKRELELIFLKEGLCPRDVEEILLDFKNKYPLAKEVLNLLLREGKLVSLTEKLVFHREILEKVKEKVFAYFRQNKELTIANFRELVGKEVSRKYLIPLLEYLDKEKITLRIGDKRVFRKKI